MPSQEKEIVASIISDNTLIALAESAERRVDALNRIKRAALKATNAHDWTDQNGNPYLQVSGSEKVGRIFGVSWRIDEPIMEREEGGHFSYTYKGYFSLAGAEIEAIGTRSSKDGFFKKYDYSLKDENGNSIKTELPVSEIDKGDVKKAAFTNCIGNGVTRILGLRNLTWDDLKEFAGITRDQIVGKIQYKKSGKQQTEIASEDAKTVTIGVSDVRKKDVKSKTGKAYTIYMIKNGEKEYSTFDEKLARIAKDAKEAGAQVQISYKTDQFGNKIEDLMIAIPEDREPGAEG